MEVSAIELKPSVRLDSSNDQDNNTSEMSSDIRNDSMFELFNRSNANNSNNIIDRPISNLEANLIQYNQIVTGIEKFKTFNDVPITVVNK